MAVTSKSQWDKIFGAPDPERRAGAQRLCKTCGGWHLLSAWPHNCREPGWRPPQTLASPRIIHDVEEHFPQRGVRISSRNEQREWMKRNDFVEHEDFTPPGGRQFGAEGTVARKQYEEDLVQDIKRAFEEDPLNRPPPMMIEQANSEATEDEAVSMDNVEVIGRDEDKHLAPS